MTASVIRTDYNTRYFYVCASVIFRSGFADVGYVWLLFVGLRVCLHYLYLSLRNCAWLFLFVVVVVAVVVYVVVVIVVVSDDVDFTGLFDLLS